MGDWGVIAFLVSMLRRFPLHRLLVLWVLLAAALPCYSADQHWIRASSQHFSVLTDAGDKNAREVLLRFEQMRAVFAELLLKTRVNISEPIDIIALKSDKEYAQVAPLVNGQPTNAPGFFLSGEDRNYIVLNLFETDSWNSVSDEFGRMLLNFNYPPTQSWFDSGFTSYFSSMRLETNQVQIGSDPTLIATADRSSVIAPRREKTAASFTALLQAPVWLGITDLFSSKHHVVASGTSQPTLYQAESWIVIHYLVNNNKLSETGKYFELVEVEHVPVEQAIQTAYGMTAVQFEQAVKEYFKSLEPQFEGQVPPKNATITAVHVFSSPIPGDTIGSSTKEVLEPEARALVAEMAARMPQQREWAIGQLQSVVADTTTDNAVAHRALAWIDIQKKDFEHATDELHTAAQLDPNDAWVRYELALVKYHQAEGRPDQFRGLSNMMQDLRAVLDWDPDFAQAYHLLALARMEGGGNNSALEAEQAAMKLNSRDESYLLGMANIYIALKKWDAATATLERLKTSSDPKIAQAASKTLSDLPMIKKYGILPQEASAPSSEQNSSKPESGNSRPPERANAESDTDDDTESNTPASATAKPDMRAVRFAKGKITNVDCSQAPAAVITVISGTRKLKFRTSDYKSLPLIGADQFSCEWKNIAVAINYKAGNPEGDLVSLELQ